MEGRRGGLELGPVLSESRRSERVLSSTFSIQPIPDKAPKRPPPLQPWPIVKIPDNKPAFADVPLSATVSESTFSSQSR